MIGGDEITSTNVQQYSHDLQVLGSDLSKHAQIELYGCDIAEDAVGKASVNTVASYIHADVFASTDLTGGPTGNWVLEYSPQAGVAMHHVLNDSALQNVHEQLDLADVMPSLDNPVEKYAIDGYGRIIVKDVWVGNTIVEHHVYH